MADSTLHKYLWLINTIKSAGKLTFNEIQAKWERSVLNHNATTLSKRTFHNHRMAILMELGVDIQCISMRENSYYFIANQEELENDTVLNWLRDSLATEALLRENKNLAEKIVLEPIPGGREWLPLLSTALQENRTIELLYSSFHTASNDSKTYEINPLCLKLFRQRWYVLGEIPKTGKRLIFALDRIIDMKLLDKTFSYPEDFSASGYFSIFFGISSDGYSEPTHVVLKCYREFPNYLRSLPLHHSQQEIEKTDSYTIYGYYLSPAFDFIQEIMSHGDFIEVLKPDWLRNLIKDKADSLSSLYQ